MFHDALADTRGPGFAAEIAKGLRVRLAAQGLTGTAYLEADYLDPARHPPLEIDWEPFYPYVPSGQSRITQLAESVDRILRNIEQVNVGRISDGVEKSLSAMTKVAESANLEKIAEQANLLLVEARETNRLAKDLIVSQDVKSTFADSAAAAKTARQLVEQAEKLLSQLLADLPKATQTVNRLVERVDSATADLPEASAQLKLTLRRLSRLIASQQYEIQTMMENLRAVSQNMREITDNSTRYPAQVLFGAPPPKSEVVGR
jgi:phospholipid/cholesterol/gamma-HCH transport system substrate-binding protein/paraquat-inducible protein B